MKTKQRSGHIRAKENNSNKAKNLHQDFGYLFLNMQSNANATVCSVFFVVFFNLQKPIFHYFLIVGVMPNEFAKQKGLDESLGRDETSCVRLATNSVLSQVSVNFIVNFHW